MNSARKGNIRRLRGTPRRATLAAIALILFALILLALAGLTNRGDPRPALRTTAGIRSSDPAFETTLALYTRTRIEPGNTVRVLLNGDSTFAALWRDLRAARRTIAVQNYFARPGAVMDTLTSVLSERAHAGVDVRLLLDAHGSKEITAAWRDRLRANGVSVTMLRPLAWQTLYRAGYRSHVRVVAIDDSIAYTGGIGFADTWLGDGRTHEQWRETNVRVEGPAAAQLRALFATYWFEATRELLPGIAVHRATGVRDGGVRAGVFSTSATSGPTAAVPFLALAVAGAERRLHIASSYFVPNEEQRGLLIDAARRGVDVRVVTAGRSTDVKTARFAGRYTYGEMLRAGVRIYEYEPTMMHAKTFSVDGVWASIGSMNLDERSTAFNDDAGVIVFDRGVVAQLDSAFADDLRFAHELTLAEFERRDVATRSLEWFAMLFSKML